MSLSQQEGSRHVSSFPGYSQGKAPCPQRVEPFGGAEGITWVHSGLRRMPQIGPEELVRGKSVDCENASGSLIKDAFWKDYKLYERERGNEPGIAQHKESFLRNHNESSLTRLGSQNDKMGNTNFSLSREPFFQQTDVEKLDDYVLRKPVEVVDGMNRISAFVGGSGATLSQNVLYEPSIQSWDHHRLQVQRAPPPVMRVQPLHSPWPPNGMPFAALQVPISYSTSQLHAGVQTEPTTEDLTGAKPLTIEHDETFTKRIQTSETVTSSTSSLSLEYAGETKFSGATPSCSDLKSSFVGSSKKNKSAKAQERQVGKLDMKCSSRRAKSTELALCDIEEEERSTSCLRVPPRAAPGPTDSRVVMRPRIPARVQIESILPKPESNTALAVTVAATDNLSGGLRKESDNMTLEYTSFVNPSTVAWYLPNSRVLESTEFKNLLCAEWRLPPKHVHTQWVPFAQTLSVSNEVAPATPTVYHDSVPGEKTDVVEYIASPDGAVPEMPPPEKQRKVRERVMAGMETDLKYDERVQKILRDVGDSPCVVYYTEEPLFLHRHNTLKRVFLLSTPYYVYLVKAKDMSFYARWPNKFLTVSSAGKTLYIGVFESTLKQQQTSSPLAVLSAEESEDAEFKSVKLEGSSEREVEDTEEWLLELAASARLRAEQLAIDERGISENEAQEVKEKEEEWGDAESEGSDDDIDHLWGKQQHQQPLLLPQPREGESSNLFQKAPSRYLAVTSLVDGEFTDYSTLKNAYLRNEEESLQEDLSAFIRENEGKVEKLCEQHYPAFLHAARQCSSISEQDAELVGQELSGATELARSSVMEMKRAAADLNLSRCVKENLTQVRSLLQVALEVAERLETVETRVRKGQLIGAVVSLKQLVRLAAPLAEYSIGVCVIHHRVPQLTREIYITAVHEFNAWLKLLRELSLPVGIAAQKWGGGVHPGTVIKKLQVSEDGEWWVETSFVRACIKRSSFGEANGIANIVYGTSLQEVFEELGQGAYYRHYYTESRAQQAKLDIYQVSLPLEGLSGEELVVELERYCATALGFILIEDIVYNVTEPRVQSTADILCIWEQISQAMADRARRVFSLLVSNCNYTKRITDVFHILRCFISIAVDSVRSVRLSPLTLSHVVETMNDSISSSWLQEACMEATQAVLTDTLLPLSVTSAEEYDAYLTQFYLHQCKFIELPLPLQGFSTGNVTLPYARMVPSIGNTVLLFLSRCHSIMVTDGGAVVRQSELNNVDEMLLKYISVLFRTVAELLQGHLASVDERAVMQLAVYVTSCAALNIIVSCVEQQFVLAWPSHHGGEKRERLGEPRLLASSAVLFDKALQKGIERLLAALRTEVEDRLRVTADVDYWKRLVDFRRSTLSPVVAKTVNKDTTEGGFPEAMNYIIAVIPKLKLVLQASVLRSVIGTLLSHTAITVETNLDCVIQNGCREGTIDEFAALRDCVKEFELLCVVHIPLWQKLIEDAISGIFLEQQFPLQPKQIADNHMLWISRKEATLAEDRANANQIIAGIEGASKLMVKSVGRGFQVVGNTVMSGASVITEAANALSGKRET